MEKKVVSTQKMRCDDYDVDVLIIVFDDGSYKVVCPERERCGRKCRFE